MPFYKDQSKGLHFIESDVFVGLLPDGCVRISDAEAAGIRGSTPPVSTTVGVPQVVTRRQALLALLAAGKLDAVELQMSNAPRAVQIAWDAAGTFERANPLIEALAPALGLAPADIDTLFIEAAKL